MGLDSTRGAAAHDLCRAWCAAWVHRYGQIPSFICTRVSGQPHPLSKHTAVAAVFLCTLQDGSGAALNNLQQPVTNLVISIICWVLLTANLCQIFFRVWRAHKLKKVWKRRRLVTCSLSILELIVQWVSQTSCSPLVVSVSANIGGLIVLYIDR